MVMCANEFKTKGKRKLTEIKKINCNIPVNILRVLHLHLFPEGFELNTVLGHDSSVNNLCVCVFLGGCSRESRKETVLSQKVSNSS